MSKLLCSALLVLSMLTAWSPALTAQIRLNQIGFYPGAPKKAVVIDAAAGSFYVLTPDRADTVFTGMLGAQRTWSLSGENTRLADFSDFEQSGTYVLAVPGGGVSPPFSIAPRIHDGLARAALKGFYYQRASTALPAAYAGTWSRAAGHPDTQVRVHASAATPARPAGTVIAAPRGWYDAGDYNKYIVNSGITVATLLSLYEDFPAYADTFSTNIPESDNALPDLLDEVLWNLRWMLTMQDPADGGVYHKLTTANFAGMVMPAQATAARYVVQKSTAATLDFAAVMAQAARIFSGFEDAVPGLADSCRTAALAAWQWARGHPAIYYNQSQLNQQFDPDIQTGEYGDGNVRDEFIWAAAELYVTTKADSFYTALSFFEDSDTPLPSWPQVRALAYYTLLRFRDALTPAMTPQLPALENRIRGWVNWMAGPVETSAYATVMGQYAWEFNWGSNSGAANQGVAMIQAYRLTGDTAYLDLAVANLDYLLGRNATGFSFVTGHGDRTPMHPHHRPSEADGVAQPVPGLLVGGPNPGRQDGCTYPSTLAAKAYVDHVCSYASNEIAINWNAPLVYLAAALEAVQFEAAFATPTSIKTGDATPADGLRLRSVAPNPFSAHTRITFTLPAADTVHLRVFDALGRVVATPVDGPLAAGEHRVAFDARALPAGVYLYELRAGQRTVTGHMTHVD